MRYENDSRCGWNGEKRKKDASPAGGGGRTSEVGKRKKDDERARIHDHGAKTTSRGGEKITRLLVYAYIGGTKEEATAARAQSRSRNRSRSVLVPSRRSHVSGPSPIITRDPVAVTTRIATRRRRRPIRQTPRAYLTENTIDQR